MTNLNSKSAPLVDYDTIKLVLISLWLLFFCQPAQSQKTPVSNSFKPGGEWLAEDGIHIDCHGGNIIYVESLKTFYWYGEHRGEPRGASSVQVGLQILLPIILLLIYWGHILIRGTRLLAMPEIIHSIPSPASFLRSPATGMHSFTWETGGMAEVDLNRNMSSCRLQ